MICGHCKQTDSTLVHVRECSRSAVRAPEHLHETPCVCSTYDLCKGVRISTARTWRDVHRAYND